jgi:hypothetical protein
MMMSSGLRISDVLGMVGASSGRRALLVTAIAAACAFELVGEPQADIEVRFGIFEGSSAGARFVETTHVPNVVGQSFGWTATLPPNHDPIPWSEELTAPSAPIIWSGPARVSTDRKEAITRGVVAPNETEFSNFWTIVPGDPSGAYKLVVKVYDGTVAEFAFELQ